VRTTRIIVGFPPGGSADSIARLLSQKLADLWGQPVVVENHLGAGGTIAADMVVKAAPDGYTLLLGDISSNAIAGSLFAKLPYDPVRDFAHVTRLVKIPLIVLVPTASPITSLQDLIQQAKAKPGQLRYSSAGAGTSPHIFLDMMGRMAEIRIEAIHYKGTGPAMTGLLSGDVDFTATSVGSALPLLQGGKLRAIAVTSSATIPTMPNVAPIATVLPGFDAYAWHSLEAPAKTPVAVVEKVNRDVATIMRSDDVRQRLGNLSLEIAVISPDESAAFIAQQTSFWREVVRAGKITAD
jgi:tripartite-type tricarboxylate transporter receptor subunit TctC